MNEFEMIRDCFRQLTNGREEAGALQDDAAILNVPDGYELVVSSDTLGAGTHFVDGEEPEHIARKALRVNLSDMAAMGAKPYCYQLNIAFDDTPDLTWVERFVDALSKDHETFKVFCSGGDTTLTKGKLHISITMMGLVPKGRAVKRSGAKAGDLIVVTGFIGDAVIGVYQLLETLSLSEEQAAPFLNAARCPVPRVAIHEAVCMHAHAAIDISDGMVADLEHICEASGLSASVQLSQVPVSDAAQVLLQGGDVCLEQLIIGGDDYELILAIAPERLPLFMDEVAAYGVVPSVIGQFDQEQNAAQDVHGVQLLDEQGHVVEISTRGWTHF